MATDRRSAAALVSTVMLIVLPLAGAGSAGLPLAPFLEFPPLTRRVEPPGFSWWAFIAVAVAAAAPLIFLTLRGISSVRRHPAARGPAADRRFPWWGWAAFLGLAAAWFLAWTRHPWTAALQPHTFTPLWLAYIVLVNAFVWRRTGRALLTHRPLTLLAFFPASAVFWWFFEYLNRFVQNWSYQGPALDAGAYFRHATLAFSTVLPAVISTRDWVCTWDWVGRAFADTPPIPGFKRSAPTWILLGAAAAGLAGVGKWPSQLYPLVWVAPLIVLSAVRSLCGLSQPFQCLRTRDWTPVVSAMLAALICGFFWELWNCYSLARWEYAVPYVQRFAIFEMPLLGYAGYLPFGLECALAAALVEELLPQPRGRKKVPNRGCHRAIRP